MDKIWVKDVKEGDRPKSVFLVARKATPTAKSGKTYLSVTFHDRTGELEARAFENVEAVATLFEEKDLVEVEGIVGTFQGKPQLRIESIAKVDPAGLDAAEFTWVPPPEPKKPEKTEPEVAEGAWQELLGLVGAITDKHVRDLVTAFIEDEDVAHRLRRSAAAKTVHHAYAGGLLEHTVSCLKLAHRIADHYPQVDRDLLVAGAFFHDLGKIRELQGERSVEYTDEGRLVGHLVMAAQWIHDKARRVGVPRDLEHHIVHIVLSHHGRLEYGSPKVPATLEALLTHYIDELDSRVNSWLNLMGREGGNRRWTSSDNVYEQPIWRGALPTAQAEKKGPAPELLGPTIYVPRSGGGGEGGQPRKDKRPKDRRPQGQRPQQAQPAGDGKPAEGAAEARPEGAPARAQGQGDERPQGQGHEARPPRPDRPPRDAHGPRGFGGGGFGDKKRGYTGPRLPGDKGPQHRPQEKKEKALTHNPFAALAAKLEDAGKAAPEAPPPVEAAPEPAPAAPEPAPPAPAEPAAEAPQAAAPPPEAKPGE